MISFFDTRRIYLDHAAATPVSRAVAARMQPYFADAFGNPEAVYAEGVRARAAITAARHDVAHALKGRSDGVIFTAGGTEANNLAVFGIVDAARAAGVGQPHIIVSAVEHPAILACARALEARGAATVSYIPVDASGMVHPRDIENALRSETVLVSIMYVNNEVGTIQPLQEIAKRIRRFRKQNTNHTTAYPVFHTDATQAPVYLPIGISALGVDAMTLDGQKIYGPKGVGVLYVSPGIPLAPHILGGSQEHGLRAGTENVPLIVGFGAALSQAVASRPVVAEQVTKHRDYFIERVQKMIPDAFVHGGAPDTRIANIANMCIPGADAEFMVVALDEHGIAAATRSACSGRDADTSHVLRAMGVSDAHAASSLRFSLGIDTTRRDLRRVVRVLARDVCPLTRMPPHSDMENEQTKN